MKKIVIAIDGYSACGKSTTARSVAARLGYAYIDTGAMYRAVTLYLLRHRIRPDDLPGVEAALARIELRFAVNTDTGQQEVQLNGENVEQDIRQMEVSEKVSEVSAIPAVRRFLVAQQQRMGQARGVVMDGRDIGTHVFPDAELKVFMTADAHVRAVRRAAELAAKGQPTDLARIAENLAHRDALDTQRADSPLARAPDAHLLDTTDLTEAQQVTRVLAWAQAAASQ